MLFDVATLLSLGRREEGREIRENSTNKLLFSYSKKAYLCITFEIKNNEKETLKI